MSDTLRLCKLNLAVHGLSGDIRDANSYYDDPHNLSGRFDYVMANPPFNQSEVDQKRLVTESGAVSPRFPLGLPTVNNANYLWINLFYAALGPVGRAGFVMANSAADTGGSEREIRRRLIETGVVDCIVSVGPNMFYTVALPVTLWFLDKGKLRGPRVDHVLFIDARHLFRQVTRSHRTFDSDHIEFLGNIVRLWRGEAIENNMGGGERTLSEFPDGTYRDVSGLCKVATRNDIINEHGLSLNPGRYVGIAPGTTLDDEDFRVKLEELQEQLEELDTEAATLHKQISDHVAELLR
jgi:type I restriction enzyme M protein